MKNAVFWDVTLVHTRATWHHILEDGILHGNLIIHNFVIVSQNAWNRFNQYRDHVKLILELYSPV
jgi:hypothetical protein